MKYLLCFLITSTLLITLVAELFGQATFQKTYGGTGDDEFNCVQATLDGGFILVGYTKSFGAGDEDVYLVKIDKFGNVEWSRTFGDVLRNNGNYVIQTSDSGYVIAGYSLISNEENLLIKTDKNGKMLWQKTLGTGYGYAHSVQQTSDGGYIISSEAVTSYGPWKFYLIKTNSSGTVEWIKAHGGAGIEYGLFAVPTSDGGYIITGRTWFSFGLFDNAIYIVKTDSIGKRMWSKVYYGGSWEQANHIQQTSDGGYILTGRVDAFGAGSSDILLFKIDSLGAHQWLKAIGGVDSDIGYRVKQTSDKGFVVAGTTKSFGGGGEDVILVKTDSTGTIEWTKAYGDSKTQGGMSVTTTSDKGYIIAGTTQRFGAFLDFDGYVIKTDSMGISGCYSKSITASVKDTFLSMLTPTDTSFSEALFTSVTLIEDTATTDTSIACYTCPLPSASFSHSIDTLEVSFTNTSTDATSWYWDFGDGVSSTSKNPTHTYAISGSYTVCLVAFNECGSDTSCGSVTVICPLPSADFTYADTLLDVDFTDASTDATSWLWDFGDTKTSTAQNPSHIYDSPGTYYVCLTATNDCGSDTTCDSITVVCPLPSSSFGFKDLLLTVDFTDSSTDATSWYWTFGDGDTSTAQHPTHTYSGSGTYEVCLFATNTCGSDTTCDSVTVVITSQGYMNHATLSIFPNPSTDFIMIEMEGETIDEVIIMNMVGDVLGIQADNKSEHEMKINTKQLPDGIYFLIIKTNKAVYKNKILKVH